MPRIFDNIDRSLLPALRETLALSERADFCVGYFNLRGWKQVDELVEKWEGGDGHCCRLLVGMQQMPKDQLRAALSLLHGEDEIDQATAIILKRKLAQDFRDQLMIGVPTNADEVGLRRLASQITSGKLVVKLFLRHSLHAKLYLHFRQDPLNPTIGYLGSSNLTFAGLAKQGELNVDVLDHDACDKLAKWFEDRWNDRFCLDISKELVEIINNSWARPEPIPPYHIYVKMAYHLAQEARAGLSEFRIPSDFGNKLFEFQKAAVKIAAHHLNKRGGVVIGDVVGLGKTLMATALARVFEDDYGVETLIICPRNLVDMWEDYRQQYRLRAKVLSITRVQSELPDLRRFRLVIIDESHNLRNREGKRYRSIAEYIESNDSKVILLSATPYNKTYLDLSNQLRLFIDENDDIGVRPEKLLRELGETEFIRRHQCPVRSLAAFEKSEHADDWRDLMRLYLVRRTRSFIQENYAKLDPEVKRKYLEFPDGTRSYFPTRVPKTVKFTIDEKDPQDQYARLFGDDVVRTVDRLTLPRYGLGNYQKPSPHRPPTPDEGRVLGDLSRAALENAVDLDAVAQKRGVVVFACPLHRTDLANRTLLRQHQRQVRKLYHEHILIHFSETPRKQVWQWVTAVGDGKRVLHREHPFFSNAPPPRLLERLEDLAIPIEMEEDTTLVDVLDRVRAALFPDSELNLFAKKPWYAKRSDQLAMNLKAGKPGAFGQFVEFHLPLARKSSRMLVRWFGMDPDDAEQTAMIGLLEAARRFDPERGYQFSTYASYWIRQSCQRYGVEWGLPMRVPIHLFWRCYRMTFVRAELIATHGERGAESQFNEKLDAAAITREQWDDFCHARQVGCFTDVDTCDRRQLTLVDEKADNADYAIEHEMEDAVHRAIESLNPRQAFILRMRYGFGSKPRTLQEIADELGITRERVRQIQARAEEKLAVFIRQWSKSAWSSSYGATSQSLSRLRKASAGRGFPHHNVKRSKTDDFCCCRCLGKTSSELRRCKPSNAMSSAPPWPVPS